VIQQEFIIEHNIIESWNSWQSFSNNSIGDIKQLGGNICFDLEQKVIRKEHGEGLTVYMFYTAARDIHRRATSCQRYPQQQFKNPTEICLISLNKQAGYVNRLDDTMWKYFSFKSELISRLKAAEKCGSKKKYLLHRITCCNADLWSEADIYDKTKEIKLILWLLTLLLFYE